MINLIQSTKGTEEREQHETGVDTAFGYALGFYVLK